MTRILSGSSQPATLRNTQPLRLIHPSEFSFNPHPPTPRSACAAVPSTSARHRHCDGPHGPPPQVNPQFLRGYVVRKRVAGLGPAAGLSCWGWYLTAVGGPELHFGGHDFFPIRESPTENEARQVRSAAGAVTLDEIDAVTGQRHGCVALPGQLACWRGFVPC